MDLHGILIVDKPRGITSHDVVARVRRLLRTRKIGHAGTLDPAAEGVLVLAIGRATRLLTDLSPSTKRYAGQIVLGVRSVSGDIEGPATLSVPDSTPPSTRDILAVLARFTGEIKQIPPAHAAIKVDGQPLYRRARRGEHVDVPSRRVEIRSLNLIDYQFPDLYIDVECSAGTYIRALARDIGEVLGCGAYLHQLVRLRSGDFSLDDAWPMEEIERGLRPESFASYALHPATIGRDAVALVLDPVSTKAWYDGRPVPVSGLPDPTRAHAFRADGRWLGLGIYEATRDVWQPKIVVHE